MHGTQLASVVSWPAPGLGPAGGAAEPAGSSNGHEAGEVVVEAGSGLGGSRPTLRRVLSDPAARVVVVKHRDRLPGLGVGHLKAVLGAHGRRLVVADP